MKMQTSIALKEEHRNIDSLSKLVEMDEKFRYWFLPQNSSMVQTFRESKCTIRKCKICSERTKAEKKELKSLPKSVVATLTNGSNGAEKFRLDESQIQKIHGYKSDLQLQAYDRSVYEIAESEALPTVNVFSKRYAPIKYRPLTEHLRKTFGEPKSVTNYSGLGLLVQYQSLEKVFEGLRELEHLERVLWNPIVLLDFQLSEKSFTYGFIGDVFHCINEIIIHGESSFGNGRGTIRHTSGNIGRFNFELWTDEWISSIQDINRKVELAMKRKIDSIMEIMLYFKASKSVPMFLEFCTRPQLPEPKSQWDVAMNITRINSPEYKPVIAQSISDEKLFTSKTIAGNSLYEVPKFRFGDLLRALAQIENSWQTIKQYEGHMKVDFRGFYDKVSDLIDLRAKKVSNMNLEQLNKPIELKTN